MIKINSPKASVSKWFASFYFIFCILFGFLLVPIIKYSEGVCRELVTEKFNQKLISASTKFDDELYAVSIIPEELVSYSDFIPYIYQKDDYMHADYKFQKQIRNIMINKFHITSMAKDFALQFNVNEVITESQIFLLQSLQYYPKFFEVDEMSANEWHSYLLQFQEQTLTFHHIKSSKGEYDALVYIVPCISDIYAYACFNIDWLKQEVFSGEEEKYCYITIMNEKSEYIYSDKPEEIEDYTTLSQKITLGKMTLLLHIVEERFDIEMVPIYRLLWVYAGICIGFLLTVVLILTNYSSGPIKRIIMQIEQVDNTDKEVNGNEKYRSFLGGFHYISRELNRQEKAIKKSKTLIDELQVDLRAVYLKNAIYGFINNDEELKLFRLYLPSFPENYRVALILLTEAEVKNELHYDNPIYLIHRYLMQQFNDVYFCHVNKNELLLIMPEENATEYSGVLNHLILNIYETEPAYQLFGVYSDLCSDVRSLPAVYAELQEGIYSVKCSYQPDKLYKKYDMIFENDNNIMIRLQALYFNISKGKKEEAVKCLEKFVEVVNAAPHLLYQMLYSVLLCIKFENDLELSSIIMPRYEKEKDIVKLLSPCVEEFSLNLKSKNAYDDFFVQIVSFIDNHYLEYELCIGMLEEQFQCSASKIRNLFKKNMGITVNDYIETKRMEYAASLITEGKMQINDIAATCGYVNVNTFYKAYKRFYGCAPTAKR